MRRPLTTLLALAAASALLVGCGSDDGDSDGGDEPSTPATSSSAPSTPSETAEPAEPGETTTPPLDPNTEAPVPPESDDPSAPAEQPADADALCTAFGDFLTALSAAPPPDGDTAPLSEDTVDAIHQWGADLSAASLPADFTDDQRAGVAAMAKALSAFPDRGTVADLDALEDALTKQEQDQADAVSEYVETTCTELGAGG